MSDHLNAFTVHVAIVFGIIFWPASEHSVACFAYGAGLAASAALIAYKWMKHRRAQREEERATDIDLRYAVTNWPHLIVSETPIDLRKTILNWPHHVG